MEAADLVGTWSVDTTGAEGVCGGHYETPLELREHDGRREFELSWPEKLLAGTWQVDGDRLALQVDREEDANEDEWGCDGELGDGEDPAGHEAGKAGSAVSYTVQYTVAPEVGSGSAISHKLTKVESAAEEEERAEFEKVRGHPMIHAYRFLLGPSAHETVDLSVSGVALSSEALATEALQQEGTFE
jgi:hypothetical protein